ncbi:[acyl-carrier-protein] S-malonyltransferase [Thiolapillus brandeum]|uniref:Malonyl CoA-acyl carrier protein transacylase n=2 Tax=Thiolapillus brandeum TaxID=1076588 RepID=A0A7U6GIR2_9GAMM|nr:[acyl-carrier-protein] S-malonyltransferase [Thiolapillus brandeum]
MLATLADQYSAIQETFEEASDALGKDLWSLTVDGPVEVLNQTENTQPAMLAAGIAAYRLWLKQGGPGGAIMAGHSLGEYSALTAAGALEFADAVRLVAARGRFMQEAVPAGEGAMAAILGLDDADVISLCEHAAQSEVAEAVNFNSPGQVVIAGTKTAIERAIVLAREAGAKRALMLPVSVPSHCALMKPAAGKLAAMLADTRVQMPGIPVLHNADVAVADTVEAIRDKLVKQLYQPVRWVETIQAMKAQGMELLIEPGPGKVLTGLGKRIDKTLTFLPVLDPASLDKALEACNA